MAKRRYRKNPGLMELAATSDWKFGAALAAACVVGAVVIIPMFFSGSAMLHGLADVFSRLAWLMAFVFGVISLVRFFKQQSDAIGMKNASPILRAVTAPSHLTPQPAAADAVVHEFPRPSRTDTATISPFAPPRPDAWSLDVLDRVEWKRFEDLCRCWTALRRAAGLEVREPGHEEDYLTKRLGALVHINDPQRLQLMRRVSEHGAACWPALDPQQRRLVQMLAYLFYANRTDLMDGLVFLNRLDRSPLMRNELAELVDCLEERYDLDANRCPDMPAQWPLVLHGAYSRTEILTAIGTINAERRPPARSGVIPLLTEKIEVLLVTLDKREGFHERIAYHDYAISPTLFHWQTQNSAGPHTMVGKRYSESTGNGWRFFLFVREKSEDPFIALGAVTLSDEPTGNRPMSITWKLKEPIPLALFQRYSVLRG